MKRHLLLVLFLVIAAVCTSLSARTYALVIGVSNYGNEENNLAQTTKDAKAFKEVMLTQTKDVTLLTSKYANKSNIMAKLKNICSTAKSSDRIVFYYSGHGMSGGIYCYDGLISYTELVNALSKSSAKYKICFIDACHAGTAASATQGGKTVETAVKGQSDQIFFVGCRSDEYSFENPWVGAGFFTQALIKGMRGKSDTNADKKITVLELFKYIYSDVVSRSQSLQHPQLIASKSLYDVVVFTW